MEKQIQTHDLQMENVLRISYMNNLISHILILHFIFLNDYNLS